jgi:D-arabinose 1-dehydrogenase-like Zn-dependent alcohol dehydrogenase
MATMRAARIPSPGADFELITRERTEPGPRQVEIRVAACGVCHSDSFVKAGQFPGLQLPRVPGHEVVGVIDRIGPGVEGWKPGDRVGVGWHGGHDFVCESCRVGDFITCRNELISGIGSDGGYAEYMIARIEALARMPAGLSDAEAAPLMCAGITTFNALRHSLARGGDTVAVLGLGGLGHLGIQFASKFGFYTVAIARGEDKRALAQQLGAHEYIDSSAGDAGKRLAALGGAKVVLATAPSARAIEEAIEGLAPGGQLMLVGAPPEPLSVSAGALLLPRLSIQGWPSGHAKDSEDTLRFCARSGVRPMVETFPLERAAEAFDRMMTGRVRFRSVITMPAKAS